MAGRNHPHWPEDLVINVLLNLPVKSIIRFKCVSTTWRSLFENPTFVSQHLSTSKSNDKNHHLLVYSVNKNIIFRLFLDQTFASDQAFFHQITKDLGGRCASVRIFHGLLCLFDRMNSRICLLNPATRDFRLLPQCNENNPLKTKTYVDDIGFGLDTVTNDYKVICTGKYVGPETNVIEDHHCAVYRMSTASWKVLNQEECELVKEYYVLRNRNNTCVNGVYYWIVVNYKKPGALHGYKVLAFDMGKEVFELIEWPPTPFTRAYANCDLLPLSHIDRISVWISDSNASGYNEIWVLSEHKNWTKLLRFGPLFEVLRMFGFWNMANDKIFIQSRGDELMVYDLKTHEFTDVGVKTMGALEVHTYHESLVTCRR